jgi:hypothetical protein
VHAHPFYFVLYLLALICFALATINVEITVMSRVRINLVAVGLFLALLPTVLALAQA